MTCVQKISIDETFLLYGVDDDQEVHYTPAFHVCPPLSRMLRSAHICIVRRGSQCFSRNASVHVA
jgi:hypothetical protein